MIRIDTIKLDIPEQAVRGYNPEAFRTTYHDVNEDTGDFTLGRTIKSDYKPVGCSGMTYKDGGAYQVTMSAKTLGQDYLEGINKNTIERSLSSLSTVVDIDFNRLIDYNPKVMHFDVTDNVSIESIGGSKREIVQSLLATKMNDRFQTIIYDSKRKFGVEFKGTQQEKNRLICYDKALDLLKSKNKKFRESLPNPLQMYNHADKTIRIESNITGLEAARDRLDIQDNTLLSILNSTAPVNHNFLLKIMNYRKGKQLNIFDEYQRMNLEGDDYILYKGMEKIFAECNNDIKSVKEFLKFVYKDNYKYRYYRSKIPLKKLIQQAQVDSIGQEESIVMTITDRLLNELKKAG